MGPIEAFQRRVSQAKEQGIKPLREIVTHPRKLSASRTMYTPQPLVPAVLEDLMTDLKVELARAGVRRSFQMLTPETPPVVMPDEVVKTRMKQPSFSMLEEVVGRTASFIGPTPAAFLTPESPEPSTEENDSATTELEEL